MLPSQAVDLLARNQNCPIFPLAATELQVFIDEFFHNILKPAFEKYGLQVRQKRSRDLQKLKNKANWRSKSIAYLLFRMEVQDSELNDWPTVQILKVFRYKYDEYLTQVIEKLDEFTSEMKEQSNSNNGNNNNSNNNKRG